MHRQLCPDSEDHYGIGSQTLLFIASHGPHGNIELRNGTSVDRTSASVLSFLSQGVLRNGTSVDRTSASVLSFFSQGVDFNFFFVLFHFFIKGNTLFFTGSLLLWTT